MRPAASAKLKTLEDLRRFPALAGCVVNPSPRPGEKLLLQLTGAFPGQLGDGFPLRALLIPRLPCFLLHTGTVHASSPTLIAGLLELNR